VVNSTVSKIWRVAIYGLGSSGLYCLERFGLLRDIQVTWACDADPRRRHRAEGMAIRTVCPPDPAVVPDDVDVLFLTEDISTESLSELIGSGRHLVIHRPWLLTSHELAKLNDLAAKGASVVTIASLRRWSHDFQTAMAAQRTGRIGLMRSLRFTSCEKRIPEEMTTTSVLREMGYHWLDQLMVLADSKPKHVYGRQVADVDSLNIGGFSAMIQFASGCSAQMEVSTTSRTGFRTGWVLEGESGSYRSGRLYTETRDAEIVDEPIHTPLHPSEDAWMDDLIAGWGGSTTALPTLADAAQIVLLIEAIEESAKTGCVVTL